MADNPEPDGPRLTYQPAYPGLHWHYGSEKLSVGTYVWRVFPHEALDKVKNQPDGQYWDDAGQSMARRM